MSKKTPLRQVLDMLEERADIHILFADTDSITGVQLRRVWTITKIPTTFSSVEKEHWKYFGQAFVVKEKKLNRDGDLVTGLGQLTTIYGRAGVEFILCNADDPNDAVIDALGPVPENFKEYLERREK